MVSVVVCELALATEAANVPVALVGCETIDHEYVSVPGPELPLPSSVTVPAGTPASALPSGLAKLTATEPELPASAVAVIAGASASYVSEILKEESAHV